MQEDSSLVPLRFLVVSSGVQLCLLAASSWFPWSSGSVPSNPPCSPLKVLINPPGSPGCQTEENTWRCKRIHRDTLV